MPLCAPGENCFKKAESRCPSQVTSTFLLGSGPEEHIQENCFKTAESRCLNQVTSTFLLGGGPHGTHRRSSIRPSVRPLARPLAYARLHAPFRIYVHHWAVIVREMNRRMDIPLFDHCPSNYELTTSRAVFMGYGVRDILM